MKNQNDLIFSIVAAVIAVGCAIGFVLTAPKPIELPAPTPVPITPVTVQEGAVVYANSLPGGSSAAIGGGGGRPGGSRGSLGGGRPGGSRGSLGGPAPGPPTPGPGGPPRPAGVSATGK